MTELTTEFFAGHGGRNSRCTGWGRAPVVLLHGLFSSAAINWVKFGTAAQLVAAGFECLMPDLRAHGQSAAPHDPAEYPADVLALDAMALVAHLGLTDFDLCGFSLGSRTSARAVLGGLSAPAGAGGHGAGRAGRMEGPARFLHRRDRSLRHDPARRSRLCLAAVHEDDERRSRGRAAAAGLDGGYRAGGPGRRDHARAGACGDKDNDNGSADRLAAALPDARRATIPGTHMSSVTVPEMGAEIVSFLTSPLTPAFGA
jgi:pimeloyl-ACP methyl ester carboxylesterase